MCKKGMCKSKSKCCSKEKMYSEESYLYAKEMYEHYKELYETVINELKFSVLLREELLGVIEEIVILMKDNVSNETIAKVVGNAMERYSLDKEIHIELNKADLGVEFCDEDGYEEYLGDLEDEEYDV